MSSIIDEYLEKMNRKPSNIANLETRQEIFDFQFFA